LKKKKDKAFVQFNLY